MIYKSNEEKIDNYINNIKEDYNNKLNFNEIIEKYNIKVKFKNKIVNGNKIKSEEIKEKLILFKIHEFEDIFDYDNYIKYVLKHNFILRCLK
jgi:hypothetical protein